MYSDRKLAAACVPLLAARRGAEGGLALAFTTRTAAHKAQSMSSWAVSGHGGTINRKGGWINCASIVLTHDRQEQKRAPAEEQAQSQCDQQLLG